MDEQEKIMLKLVELGQARIALQNLRPPDVEGFQVLSVRISGLQTRFVALGSQPLPQLSDEEVRRLQGAVQTLRTAVTQSAGATQIMTAATTLLNS